MATEFDRLIERAAKVVEALAGEFEEESRRNSRKLQENWSNIGSDIDKNGIDACFRVAHDIKGQSATFGYPLLTNVADSLCALLKLVPSEDRLPEWAAAVQHHVDAVDLITSKGMKGDGGRIGAELFAALQGAAAKFGLVS